MPVNITTIPVSTDPAKPDVWGATVNTNFGNVKTAVDTLQAAPAGLTVEEVSDQILATVISGAGITVTPNDAGNTIMVTATGATGGLPLILPETYGAVGNGTTDDSTAVQAAVDAANTANAAVWFTAGRKYRCTINVNNKHFVAGGGGTLIQRDSGTPIIDGLHNPTTAAGSTHANALPVTASGTMILGNTVTLGGVPETQNIGFVTVANTSLNQFKTGDVWLLFSEDVYPWSAYVASTNPFDYKACMFPVAGVVYPISPLNGGPAEENLITGATSGATARVGSYAAGDTNRVLLNSITGTFTVGETITVAGQSRGTISAAGSVAMKGQLDDTYTTAPKIRKMRTDLRFVIDGLTLDTGVTNEDSLDAVGISRDLMISLAWVARPDIRVIVKNTYKEAISLRSCWKPRVDMRINRAPNMALTENAYGYGVEITGTTEAGFYRIFAENVRHAFTTNTNAYTAYPTSDSSISRTGTQRDNVVTGMATNCWGGGWDSHYSAIRTTFLNCVNMYTTGAFRDDAVPYGYQNRSMDTHYINCTDYGSMTGFKDGTAIVPWGRPSTTRWTNCLSINHMHAGFLTSNNNEDTFPHRFIFENCVARGDGRAAVGAFSSIGFKILGGYTEINNCRAERFTKNPIEITNTASNNMDVIIHNFVANYSETPATAAAGIRTNGTVARDITIDGLAIVQKPGTPAMPASAVTADGASTTTIIRWGSEIRNLNTTTVIPWYSGSAVTHQRISGSNPNLHVGTAAPGLAILDNLWYDSTAAVLKRYNGTAWV